MSKSLKLSRKRKVRVRKALKAKQKTLKPRLSVFRSNKHIYAQIIDDEKGITIACVSSNEKTFEKEKQTSNSAMAAKIGEAIAERAQKNKITEVVFDRGPYLFHGRVKALADAARSKGLKF